MHGILTTGAKFPYSRCMTAEKKIIALSDRRTVTDVSGSFSLLCQQWVCRPPVFITFHVVDEEEKCVSGTRRGGERLQLLALVLWNHIKHMKAPSYLNCCSCSATWTLQMCRRGPTVGSPCRVNHATGPQAPLCMKRIGAWPASPHPIMMLVWLGTCRGGKSLGEATRLPQSCWPPGWPESWTVLKARPPFCGQMWLGHLAAQRLGYLRPKRSLRFMQLEDLVLVISHSSSQWVSSEMAGAPFSFSGCWCWACFRTTTSLSHTSRLMGALGICKWFLVGLGCFLISWFPGF